MSGWPIVELGGLAVFRNGLNYSSADAGVGLAVVGVSDFKDNSFVDFASLDELAPSALATEDALVRRDDILFVRSNGNRELIGRSLLVSHDPPKPTSHSGFTIRLRFHDHRADPRFFAYLLRGGTVRRHLSSQGGGTSINNLNQGILSRMEVPLPPLETQRRIASILGAYDDLIEVNRRRVAVLEEMARGLFEEWFVRFRFPGHETAPLVDTTDGSLPAGWRNGTLGDLVDFRRDGTQPGEHLQGRAYVPIECIGRRTLVLDEVRPWQDAQSSLQLFEKGDILFGAMRAYFHKVAPAPLAGVTRSTCFVLRPREPQFAAYALMQLFQDDTVAYAAAHSKGSTIPYAQWGGVLERMSCAVPDLGLAEKFQAAVQPMIDLLEAIWACNHRLAASRDLLLPRLISGQLSVEVAECELQEAA
ncbi:restriction endonuclease subunit S [Novosphingobium flavum]|uniref:Restriction endonuclease subunit S n=1 Tax=Novosphingobium flavum TaxID=1778672 RepID=A0A7X1KLK4_9SPHN|nr:restriction endonuclease subunit S [Novosphingobium flavum]MBC2665682.1 restriction endonuclease subunit S [Novosphingobium flavum]